MITVTAGAPRGDERTMRTRGLPGVVAGLLLLAACGTAPAPPAFDLAYGAGEAQPLAGIPGVRYITRGDGEPVVFYYPGSAPAYWQFLLDAATGRHRVIHFTDPAPPMPAAARPPGPPGPPPANEAEPLGEFPPGLIDLLASAFIATLESLGSQAGANRVHLVTHSFGGLVVQQAALERPDLFRTLVLIEPMGPASMFDDPAVALPPNEAEHCTLEDADAVRRRQCIFTNSHSGAGYFESLPAPMRRYLIDEGGTTAAAGIMPPIRADMRDVPSSLTCARLGTLSMPILYIRGKDSTPFTQAQYDVHEKCLPPHETVFVEAAGHMTFWDQPEAVNEALLGFIARHPL